MHEQLKRIAGQLSSAMLSSRNELVAEQHRAISAGRFGPRLNLIERLIREIDGVRTSCHEVQVAKDGYYQGPASKTQAGQGSPLGP